MSERGVLVVGGPWHGMVVPDYRPLEARIEYGALRADEVYAKKSAWEMPTLDLKDARAAWPARLTSEGPVLVCSALARRDSDPARLVGAWKGYRQRCVRGDLSEEMCDRMVAGGYWSREVDG